jgi:TolB protein
VDIDGGNAKQLTEGNEDYVQNVSPDSRWVLFDSWRSGRRTPWKISIDGGQATQVIDTFTSTPQYSPDGKLIAAYYREDQAGSPWRLMIVSSDGGPLLKKFETVSPVDEAALNVGISWSPDGRSILYVSSKDGTTNLWSQPVEGGAPKQLTKFAGDGIGMFAFSHDGRAIAFVRTSTRSDVVLIRDFR